MGAPTSQAFPWVSNEITFESLSHFEEVIEQFARAGSPAHLNAVNTLLRRAIGAGKITADKYREIEKRLHL